MALVNSDGRADNTLVSLQSSGGKYVISDTCLVLEPHPANTVTASTHNASFFNIMEVELDIDAFRIQARMCRTACVQCHCQHQYSNTSASTSSQGQMPSRNR